MYYSNLAQPSTANDFLVCRRADGVGATTCLAAKRCLVVTILNFDVRCKVFLDQR